MLVQLKYTRHGYVFSMAVGTIEEWLKLVPFWLGDEQLIRGGGDWQFLKINILAVKHLKINIMAYISRNINEESCIHQIQIGYILK